jgi:hypothetical protein
MVPRKCAAESPASIPWWHIASRTAFNQLSQSPALAGNRKPSNPLPLRFPLTGGRNTQIATRYGDGTGRGMREAAAAIRILNASSFWLAWYAFDRALNRA